LKRAQRLRTDLAVCGLRLWVGLNLALGHGLPKLQDQDTFLTDERLRELPWSETLGWASMLSLFGGGLLLAVGLLTRTAAGFLLATLLGAALIALQDAPFVERELALTYAVALLVLLVHGPGTLSVDQTIEKRRRSRSPW